METDGRDRNSVATAFVEYEARIKESYGSATLDPREFRRTLKACAVSCRGVCCYGGVSVDDSTADVLINLSKQRAVDFRAMGLTLPDRVVARTEWRGRVGNITALKPRLFRSLVSGYPAHFDETACVFLTEDARCGLQVLAQKDGKHPWYYKPFSCWLHPIKLHEGQIRLFDEQTDPFIYPDYDGFVCRAPCGRSEPGGTAAGTVLSAELGFLGDILGRDLVAEASCDEQAATHEGE
jgi:hypothetical protein